MSIAACEGDTAMVPHKGKIKIEVKCLPQVERIHISFFLYLNLRCFSFENFTDGDVKRGKDEGTFQ